MIRISRTTHLDAPPERVWELFCDMDSHYVDWHREHLNWRWLAGTPLSVGTVWFADERIGWLRVSSRFFVVASEPGRSFAFRGPKIRSERILRAALPLGDFRRHIDEEGEGLIRLLSPA